MFQVGCLILGAGFWGVFFYQNPGTAPFEIADGTLRGAWALAVLGLVFIAGGIATGRQHAQFLRNGRLVSGHASKIEDDYSGEDMKYKYLFKYLDGDGQPQVVRSLRYRYDITIAEPVSMMIDENSKEAIVEQDLAGGLTFENVSGAEPLSALPLLRVGVVPLLTFVPLLFLQPHLAAYIQRASASGYALLITLPLLVQTAWLFANKKYLIVSVTELCPSCAQSKST